MAAMPHDLIDRSSAEEAPAATGSGRAEAPALARGICRLLEDLGYATLTEFTLRSGRRVDVIGLDGAGQVLVAEIKTSIEDFRSDQKWPEYLAFCDLFFFAVPERFPREVLPEDSGLIVADPYGAVILRDSPLRKLNASRRRAQTLRFGLAAAQRLTRLTDPR
ncbi:MAG: MmcB family DNA repair protein [Kiloniellales bacterium]|nr:MmcB family DNA repair protein [Kiloniellales bacterium]